MKVTASEDDLLAGSGSAGHSSMFSDLPDVAATTMNAIIIAKSEPTAMRSGSRLS